MKTIRLAMATVSTNRNDSDSDGRLSLFFMFFFIWMVVMVMFVDLGWFGLDSCSCLLVCVCLGWWEGCVCQTARRMACPSTVITHDATTKTTTTTTITNRKGARCLFGRRLLGVFLKKETRTETTAFIMGTLSQDHLGKQNGKCSLV